MKNKRKMFLFIVLSVGIVICIYLFVLPMMNYNRALKKMEGRDYQEAITNFERLGSYKNSQELLKKCEYTWAIDLYTQEKDLEKAESLFSALGEYEESALNLSQCRYKIANDSYDKGDFEKAKQYLEKIERSPQVESMLQRIEVVSQFQGEWYAEYFNFGVCISGWNVEYYALDGDLSGKQFERKWDTEFVDSDFTDESLRIINPLTKHTMQFIPVGNNVKVNSEGYTFNLTRMQFKNAVILAPALGMTAEQVECSTWGKPTKINKTTATYGITEQWCYSNNRYIYLDDGVVTVIQE